VTPQSWTCGLKARYDTVVQENDSLIEENKSLIEENKSLLKLISAAQEHIKSLQEMVKDGSSGLEGSVQELQRELAIERRKKARITDKFNKTEFILLTLQVGVFDMPKKQLEGLVYKQTQERKEYEAEQEKGESKE